MLAVLLACAFLSADEPTRTADDVKRELVAARAKVAALEAELAKLEPVKVEKINARTIRPGLVGRFEDEKGPVELRVTKIPSQPGVPPEGQFFYARADGLRFIVQGYPSTDLADGKVLDPKIVWEVGEPIFVDRERHYQLSPYPRPKPRTVPPKK